VLFADDIHAELDAFIANEHRRSRDELAHLMLALSAERTIQSALGIAARGFRHGRFSRYGGDGYCRERPLLAYTPPPKGQLTCRELSNP
jgi:hypothetical protein